MESQYGNSIPALQISDPSLNPASPFYLHPNESPALILVSPPLIGPNYRSWARAMRVALLSKNKLRFVDGPIIAPDPGDPLYAAWERCNMMVGAWITKCLSSTIAQSVLGIDRAYDIWSDLKDQHSQGDLFRIAKIQEEIYNLKQGELSVNEYFTQLKIL